MNLELLQNPKLLEFAAINAQTIALEFVQEQTAGSLETKKHDDVIKKQGTWPRTMYWENLTESVEDTLHGRLETARLFMVCASSNIDVQDMIYENVNVSEDVLLFNGDDSEPENCFPTFHIYNMSECLSLWTEDAEDFMFDINTETCLTDDLKMTRKSIQL